MGKIDAEYVADYAARISGVPARVYRGEKLLFSRFPAPLPRDPALLYKKEIFDISDHVGYIATPLFHYYGVVNSGNTKIILGPTAQIMANEQKLRELAFELDLSHAEINDFVSGMNAISRIPPERLLQLLCLINHVLNGEKLALSDIAIRKDRQETLKIDVERERTEKVYEIESPSEPHNTLALEEEIMEIVRRGDSIALKRRIAEAPAVESGRIAGDQLRQMRNLFIITATLASRAAIRGGMREDDAFSLSDAYIQRVELLGDHNAILNFQYHMLLEFTEQVEKLRRGKHATKFSLDVANYVRHHLSEPVNVEKMAKEFYISRPYLSAKFKAETDETLTDFILKEKTEEAKRLLRYSERSLSAIAAYLGFSSQGHFSRVFKKYEGVTPGEYRNGTSGA